MSTWIARAHSIETQKVEPFTGEGAYHGSTKQKPPGEVRPLAETADEGRPTTLERYLAHGATSIGTFEAQFDNRLDLVRQLDVPSQEQVRDDGVTFCWCPFEEAVRVAGPLTRSVLEGMRAGLTGRKRHVYVDSKIQYFEPGDLPVDSSLWHVDGSVAVRDRRVLGFHATVLHDMRASLERDAPPTYMAYQSSGNCRTGWLDRPLRLRIPELIPDFKAFDADVRALGLPEVAHPAGAILAYDGRSLHLATHATSPGWRLWLRCTETDVEIIPSAAIIDCYGTVFRPRT
jgi:hypothetical protein